MKLLFVADGRSPIANNWITYFSERGDEIHLVSTFLCEPIFETASFGFVPVAFSQLKVNNSQVSSKSGSKGFIWSSSFVNMRTAVRRFLSPLTISSAAKKISTLIEKIEPDLVHAMRIPFEGMLAAKALENNLDLPLVISVWGNDFTLHAGTNPWMRSYTRRAMDRVDGLHTDCNRDLNLAFKWGFSNRRPAVVLPGNGGVQIDIFYPPGDEQKSPGNRVINPRGVRSYIRNDTFFNAIPQILARHPDIKFLCPGMSGEAHAHKLVEKLNIASSVDLLPKVSRSEMAALFRQAAVGVPS